MRSVLFVVALIAAVFLGVQSQEDEDLIIPSGMGKVKVLNDDTFEHQTQATTGSTTGNWIVLFCKNGCSAEDESKFAKTAKDFWDAGFIYAKLEPGKSEKVLERFQAYMRKTPIIAAALAKGRMTTTSNIKTIEMWIATLQPQKFKYFIPKEKSIVDDTINWLRNKLGF